MRGRRSHHHLRSGDPQEQLGHTSIATFNTCTHVVDASHRPAIDAPERKSVPTAQPASSTWLTAAIACANVAGVLLARATARRREIAVRLAIGAGRGRLIRQLLAETLLLFSLGEAAGLLLARATTSLLVTQLPSLPVPVDVSFPLDFRVGAFTAVLPLIAAIASGLVPALHASRADVVTALKDDAMALPDRMRLHSAFVVMQVALSLVLAASAGLFMQSLRRTTTLDQSFDPEGVEVAALDQALGGYTSSTGRAFALALRERVRQAPGVQAASLAHVLPGAGAQAFCCGVTVPGVSPPRGQQAFSRCSTSSSLATSRRCACRWSRGAASMSPIATGASGSRSWTRPRHGRSGPGTRRSAASCCGRLAAT